MSARILFRSTTQRGLTLVELLIALALGLVVLLVVSQIYLSGRQSYRTQTGFGGMQENGGSLLEMGRPFLDDGDEVVIRGRAGELDLGAVSGTIVPPR